MNTNDGDSSQIKPDDTDLLSKLNDDNVDTVKEGNNTEDNLELLMNDEFYESTNKDAKEKNKSNRFSLGNVIRYTIMAVAAAVFLYSGFMLLKIYLGYKQGNDIYKSIANTVLTPVNQNSDDPGDGQLPFKYNHQALLDINSEGIGYLYIPSISIQLPLVQGTDNDYYLTHTFNRTYNGAGTLFEDYRISNGIAANHVILYGHNMKNGSMFAGLSKYLTPSFYQTQGNDVFYIYTQNKLIQYKIFSIYISEPISDTYNFNFTNVNALRDYANSMKKLSNYDTGVDISNTNQVVTLSTCTSDGTQRIIVQGTYVGETPLE